MKSALIRSVLMLTVLVLISVILPVSAGSEDEYVENPVDDYVPGFGDYYLHEYRDYYLWPYSRRHSPRSGADAGQVETIIESIPAEGWCYTAVRKVNVRSLPSIYSSRVTRIRAAGTELTVSARVKNSSGEIWYAVRLASGTMGYIRSDLLNTNHVILLEDPYAYEQGKDSDSASDSIAVVTPQPEPTPEVIYITVEPPVQPTPTPIYVYVTPTPDPNPQPEVTPQILFITPEPGQG